MPCSQSDAVQRPGRLDRPQDDPAHGRGHIGLAIGGRAQNAKCGRRPAIGWPSGRIRPDRRHNERMQTAPGAFSGAVACAGWGSFGGTAKDKHRDTAQPVGRNQSGGQRRRTTLLCQMNQRSGKGVAHGRVYQCSSGLHCGGAARI